MRANGQGSNKQTETRTDGSKSGPNAKTSHSRSPISLPVGYMGHMDYPKVLGTQEMIFSTTTLQVTTGKTEAQRRVRGPSGL